MWVFAFYLFMALSDFNHAASASVKQEQENVDNCNYTYSTSPKKLNI